MNSGKVILGVLAGVAVGAMAGILFAPEKGSVTRKKISDKGEDYLDEIKEKFDGFLSAMKNTFEDTQKEAEDMVSKAKATLNEARKETQNSNFNL
jgi:gas vesicle protein